MLSGTEHSGAKSLLKKFQDLIIDPKEKVRKMKKSAKADDCVYVFDAVVEILSFFVVRTPIVQRKQKFFIFIFKSVCTFMH